MGGPEGSLPPSTTEESLGSALARLRRAANLTGKALADAAGMSQSKISRIENGVGAPPSEEEVTRLARALGASAALTRSLVGQARQLHDGASHWQSSSATLAVRQHDTEHLETSARDFKIFQPAVVIGLLQTSGYAQALLSPLQDPGTRTDPIESGAAVTEAVSARVHRQTILNDTTKRFDFVMSEAVLSNRVCPPEEMPAQIRRLRVLAERENVTISLVPAETEWALPPLHGFSLLDDRHLFVDLFNIGLIKHDRTDAKFYARVFAAMKAQATTDIDDILDRYLDLYLDRSRPEGHHQTG